jgi:ParB/RepB/Spo0J family partition protein
VSDPVVKPIEIERIFIDEEFNCRGKLVPIDVEDLARDIKENGLHQPVVVAVLSEAERAKYPDKDFKLVAGFRRTFAHRVLREKMVLALIKGIMSDIEARVLNLSENLKRKDLNIAQEAKALENLFRAGVPRDQVAKKIGMSSGWVQTRYAFLTLDPQVQVEAAAGLFTQYEIKRLASMTKEEQYAAVRTAKEAKERGDKKLDTIQREKPKPTEKKSRSKKEIQDMMFVILESIGPSVVTRAMAWATGEVSDLELYADLKKFDDSFEPPPLE